MNGDSPETIQTQDFKEGEAAAKLKLSDEARLDAPLTDQLRLNSSELLKPEPSSSLSVSSRQEIASFVGTTSAGISGTVAWSMADRALGQTRYGLAARLAASVLVGAATRFTAKGATEIALLAPQDRSTGLSDLAWGGVDALAAVGAVKTEQSFSNAWKTSLGRASGSHLGQEIMQDQGRKILEGKLGQRILHNTLRGIVGGGTGALLWSTPHAIADNFDSLNSSAGWERTGSGVLKSTLFGAAFGGILSGGGTALWNAPELAASAKAALQGKAGHYSLDVYHFNDGHSSVLGERSTLPQLARKAEEGRAASLKAGRASILADQGDAHSGNAAAVVSNTGQLEQELIHEHLKVDSSIPGNHVADTGNGTARSVSRWIDNIRNINDRLQTGGRELPGLAANVQSVLDPQFIGKDGIYKPYRIFNDPLNGEKVGLVGLVTDQLQNATPRLIDPDLAIAASKYGSLSLRELGLTAHEDSGAAAVFRALSENKPLQKLLAGQPEAKLSSLVEQSLESQNLKGLSPSAQQTYRSWFQLAGENPQAKLAELAAKQPENKSLQDLAQLYPEKRIADLHEVMVSDPEQALTDSIDALSKQGVNKVIVMSHLGKTADMGLAKTGPRVAAIFGGHSHDLEPVPLYIRNKATGSDVLVSQAGHSYGWLGESNLVFNKDGSINRYLSSGKMHVIDETVKPLQSAADAVTTHMRATPAGQTLLQHASEQHPLEIEHEITLDNIRGQQGKQTPLANLVVAAFKQGGDRVLPEVNASRLAEGLPALGDSVDAVLVQSGGIRAGLPAGPVDELTLHTMFMNRPALVQMTGKEIQKTLSYGVHDFPGAIKPEGFVGQTVELLKSLGRSSTPLSEFDATGKNVIAGQLRFQIDRSLPTYERVNGVEILDQASGKYVPIEADKQYTVMTVSHLLGRIGNTPMIPAAQLRGSSLNDLGPQYWVLGRQVEPSALAATMKPSELAPEASKGFLLDYLKANSASGKFSLPESMLQSPMKDLSPGAWIPPLRPSISAAAIGATAAKNKELSSSN